MIVTGCPKSGTHWLAEVCRRAGKRVRHVHLQFARWDGVTPVACIFRDPRDVLVSMCRHRGDILMDHAIVARILDFYHGSLPAVYRSYLGYWTARSPFVSVRRFSDMTEDVPSPTKTGRHSDWTEYWSDMIDRTWRDAGGFELEVELDALGLRFTTTSSDSVHASQNVVDITKSYRYVSGHDGTR